MKILALITDGLGGSGGIAQYTRDLICALAAMPCGAEITVLPRLGEGGRTMPSNVRQLKSRSNKVIYSLAALATAMKGSFDAVYCGHLHLAPLAAVVGWYSGMPLWLQLHGGEAWGKISRAESWAAHRASLITSVSRYTKVRFLSEVGIDPSRVRVLPPTVEARFSPGAKPRDLLDRFRLRGKRVLLTVSRLDSRERGKGHDRIIRALPAIIAAFPDAVYLIVGGGEDRMRLETLARSNGVEKNVVFAGRAEPDELPSFYRLADVFVMPSMQEGFGISFLEAAASGIPVIGGNADGSADALADGAVGTAIDPHDPAALIAAIKAVLAGRGGDPAGVQRFAYRNFSEQLCELLPRFLRAADAVAT